MANILRERALLFLDRRIAELETQAVNHTAMADQAVSYAERRRVEAAVEAKKEKNQTELEAMQWVRSVIADLDQ